MKVVNNSFQFDEKDASCRITPRIAEDKGWGWLNGTIGEVFAFHAMRFDGNVQDDLEKVETVKLLYIAKDKRLSTHYHLKKSEIFICAAGSISVHLTRDGEEREYVLVPGDAMRVLPGMVHYMKGLADNNILLEVSTQDFASDSIRIEDGDKIGQPYVKKVVITEEENTKLELVKDLSVEKITEAIQKLSVVTPKEK
jgi:quercetin dioxygenase-like cupin family protein